MSGGAGIFYGVGVGPGDPELLTLKAVQLLKEAPVVVVPQASRGQESLALSVVREHLSAACRVHYLHFPMTRDENRLGEAWDVALTTVRGFLDEGKNVLFLTIGDPMLYSTCIYVLERLQARGYAVQVIPGVPSFCAAAAAAAFPLVKGDERLAVLPWNEKDPPSSLLLSSFDTVVLLKVASHLPRAVAALKEAGLLQQSVLVSNCGRTDEAISGELEKAARQENPPPYLSLILARRQKEEL